MKKHQYLDTIENIRATESQKEEIWEKLQTGSDEAEADRKGLFGNRKLRVRVAAVFAVICLVGGGIPVAAAAIQSLIAKQHPGYGTLVDSVEKGIFTKSDGHIQVAVDEILSDGLVVNMVVCYTALDSKGQKWLAKADFEQMKIEDVLRLAPDWGNSRETSVNCGCKTEEIKEFSDEKQRVFLIEMNCADRDYVYGKGIFRFPMTESSEEAVLEISENVKVRTFVLSSEENASEYYTPSYLELSEMSYVVYAYNHGVYERFGENGERWLLPRDEVESLEDKTYFIMKDGSIRRLHDGWHTTTFPKEEKLNSDVILCSGSFRESTENRNLEMKVIDVEGIDAIVINGVRFEMKETTKE